jgi:hypothetical protein
MDSDTFTIVADQLCELSELDRLEARGTLRIALKKAGVDAKSFGLDELAAAFKEIMPGELAARGCADSGAILDAIMQSLKGGTLESAARSSDEIMRRLGGG